MFLAKLGEVLKIGAKYLLKPLKRITTNPKFFIFVEVILVLVF
jgi:hypothetical protein